ncbi:NAD-dependent epimerase/dehydratase family protein [Mycobacterium sp. 4D054]|uniref:NAD-dependent epimerase/dehydratase family protein n=1 Tax=unclassified Mycobacterium TaxID=2642494 RepID=UPI0021B426BB|nr:NAD-dependent epimerase/dehydratase family protein [Mycobacterium sp. SMC-8]UXA10817.1 NAD-dependent epimerase/dehydratase family protein [Mycobacterium sp. SMC-8]
MTSGATRPEAGQTRFARVLVTGGAGFLGRHLCAALVRCGAQVVCVDNLSTSSRDADPVPGVEFVHHDVSRPLPEPWRHTAFDTIFHLACPASPPDYLRLPLATLRTGALGTAEVLDMADRHGARVVLASTSEVYGDPLEHPQCETYWGNVNPIGPRSVYDEAKRYAEALAFAHRRERGTDIGVARIFNTYGPGMRPDDGRMVPTFCGQALRGEPLTVAGDGTQTRSLCYVDDTIAGLIALAAADCPGPVNIGNPVELPVLRCAEIIRDLVGAQVPIEHLPAATDDPQRRCPDITVARQRLGWSPKVGYLDGLTATVEWFRCALQPMSEPRT